MKAEIDQNGKMIITPETELESFALMAWKNNLINGPYIENRTPEALDDDIIITEYSR